MNILFYAVAIWVLFYVVIKYLEFRSPAKLYAALDNIKVSISIFYIKWHTTALNDFFHKGRRGKNLLKKWFFVGVMFGGLFMVAAVALLVCNIFFVIFLWKSEAQKVNGVLTPVIPGVNVPTSHLGYYLFALLVAGVLHEFGHAFAAASEKCKINSFGMFLMGVYPGAFVDIGNDGLQKLNPLSQLRIYCGGAWHNAVVTAVCCLILYILPTLVLPLYVYSTEGPYVMSVHPESVFNFRVSVGDTITGIGGCTTKTAKDFENCIIRSFSHLGNNSVGYCLKDGYLADYGKETLECFDSDYMGLLQGFVSHPGNEPYCLAASEVMLSPECNSQDESYGCQCVFPRLAPNSALLQLHVRTKSEGTHQHQSQKRHITFVGTPQELWYSFTVRDYNFRFDSLSFLDVDIPYIINKSLQYLASISAALALLNMAPVYYLDGEWCLKPFLQLVESFFGITLLKHRPPPSPSSSSSSSPSSSSTLSLTAPTPLSHRSTTSSAFSPSLPYNPYNTPFHFVDPTHPNFASYHHQVELGERREEGKEREKEGKDKEKDAVKAEEEPLVRNILRVMTVLFVINIGLSFINLART